MKSTLIVLCIGMLSMAGSRAHAEEPIFDAPMLYHCDANNHGIAMGDFNNDGIPDIAQAQDYYKYVFVHLGNGDGTFQSAYPLTFATNWYPRYIAAGDVNGDGLDDVVALAPGSISVLNIFFSDSSSLAEPNLSDTATFRLIQDQAESLRLADENQDGLLDILVSIGFYEPVVLYNNGDSTFADPAPIGITPAYDFRTEDLNHDGYPDFVANYSATATAITLSDGLGGYLTPDSVRCVDKAGNPLMLLDLNGDDELDLAYRGTDFADSWVEVAINLGNGQFDTAMRFDILPPEHLVFTAADVFGDGLRDIVSVNTNGNTYAVISQSGPFTFDPAVLYPSDQRPGPMLGIDFNGDGFDDLLNAGWSALGVYMNRGDGTFPQADYFNIPTVGGYNIYLMLEATSYDFDGDSYPDIALFGQKGEGIVFDGHFFSIFYNDGTGHFGPSYDLVTLEWIGIAKQNGTDYLVTGDFIGDSAADLAVCGTGHYKIYTGPLSSGGTGLGELFTAGSPTSDRLVGLAADVDRDGDQDLVLAVGRDLLIKFNEDGVHVFDTTFEDLTIYGITSLDTLDIDNDGDLDLAAVAMPGNRFFTMENDGNGNFSARQATQLVPYGAGDLFDVEAADFNNDGYGDAAVLWDTAQDATTGMVQPAVLILMNNGTGDLLLAGSYHHIASAKKLAAADFDGDGDFDLALNARYPKGAAVLVNDGTGSFAATGVNYAAMSPGGGNIQLSANDFNRDGRPDIALLQEKGALAGAIGTIALLWNAGGSASDCPAAGDVDQSGAVKTSDIIYLVNYILKAGSEPVPCIAAGDVNCDGTVVLSDVVYLVNYVLKGGPVPCDVCTLIPATWSCP